MILLSRARIAPQFYRGNAGFATSGLSIRNWNLPRLGALGDHPGGLILEIFEFQPLDLAVES